MMLTIVVYVSICITPRVQKVQVWICTQPENFWYVFKLVVSCILVSGVLVCYLQVYVWGLNFIYFRHTLLLCSATNPAKNIVMKSEHFIKEQDLCAYIQALKPQDLALRIFSVGIYTMLVSLDFFWLVVVLNLLSLLICSCQTHWVFFCIVPTSFQW